MIIARLIAKKMFTLQSFFEWVVSTPEEEYLEDDDDDDDKEYDELNDYIKLTDGRV